MIREEVLFTKEECELILNSAKEFSRSTVGTDGRYSPARTSSENTVEIDGKLKKLFLDKFSTFKVVSLPKTFKVIKYDEGTEYKRHKDNSKHGYADRYKSISIQLNDTYDDGELAIWEGKNKFTASKEIGNTVFFDSGLDHQAFPPSLGIRYSAVFWLSVENMGKSRGLL